MTTVYLQRSASGYRSVRGELVRRIQLNLQTGGSDPGIIDGIYGNDTENAVKDFQSNEGIQISGKITHKTWGNLMEEEPPSILDRCLQLTGDFEGHGFQKIVGNFDGAGLTWGIIGFTLKYGQIQMILMEVKHNYPVLLEKAFGDLIEELQRILDQDSLSQLDWANNISVGIHKYRVEPSWENAFNTLGTYPEVQKIQLKRVNKYWDIAQRDSKRFQLTTDMGMALCFDIAVQNGGINSNNEEFRIRRWLESNPAASDRDKRLFIANVVAENSLPQYVEDVRDRKRTIAIGEGTVHGSQYSTIDWGISEYL